MTNWRPVLESLVGQQVTIILKPDYAVEAEGVQFVSGTVVACTQDGIWEFALPSQSHPQFGEIPASHLYLPEEAVASIGFVGRILS